MKTSHDNLRPAIGARPEARRQPFVKEVLWFTRCEHENLYNHSTPI